MSKLRFFFAASVLVLGALLAVTIIRPLTAPDKYTQVAAESLLSTGSGWVLQFNIVNHEGHDTTYSVGVQNGNQTGGDSFVVKDGGTYTYIYNILQQKAGGQLDVSVFKEGDSQPFEHSTYYLK